MRSAPHQRRSKRIRKIDAKTPPSLSKLAQKSRLKKSKEIVTVVVDCLRPFRPNPTCHYTLGYFTNIPIAPLSPYVHECDYECDWPSDFEELIKSQHFANAVDKSLPSNSSMSSKQTDGDLTKKARKALATIEKKGTGAEKGKANANTSENVQHVDPSFITEATNDRVKKLISSEQQKDAIGFFREEYDEVKTSGTKYVDMGSENQHSAGSSTILSIAERKEKEKLPPPTKNTVTIADCKLQEICWDKANTDFFFTGRIDFDKQFYMFRVVDDVPIIDSWPMVKANFYNVRLIYKVVIFIISNRIMFHTKPVFNLNTLFLCFVYPFIKW